jgi:DNA-binding response OmpR family regulator
LPIDNLSPRELQTLMLLARGRANYLALEILTIAEEADANAIKVRISQMRRKLRHLPFRIVNDRGHGYRLEAIDVLA